MRGKPLISDKGIFYSRITPAGAGKTLRMGKAHRRVEDHPRRCGENNAVAYGPVVLVGSPPQVRGKRLCSQTPTVGNRITPAGAGKTKLRAAYHVITQDHPRRCGENQRFRRRQVPRRGSPPQVRGKPLLTSIAGLPERITPAGAGKTNSRMLD